MLQDHIRHISSSRLSTYLVHFYAGDQSKLAEAIALYTAIQHRSGIFFSLIQEIEVAMRNAISECLRNISPNNDLRVYFDFLANDSNSPLSDKAKKLLRTSINKASTADENDIIANISFGFWVNLLDVNDRNIKRAFRQLFPNAFPNFNAMHLAFKQVQTFRNDLFHQDKAWNKKRVRIPEHILLDYKRTYKNFETILSKIAPERLNLRNFAAINNHYNQLNFDLAIFNQEIQWLAKQL